MNPWKSEPGKIHEYEFKDGGGRTCVEVYAIGPRSGRKYSQVVTQFHYYGWGHYLEEARVAVKQALAAD